jgi:alkyldihydroxyacetonephosphate synthase
MAAAVEIARHGGSGETGPGAQAVPSPSLARPAPGAEGGDGPSAGARTRGAPIYATPRRLRRLSDTFETAITWDVFPDFHAEVMETARRAVAEASGGRAEGPGSPRISCRFTHVYPDGPAPYYTVLAQARRGDEVAQWDAIKAAVSDTVIDAGGTITHHHAIGRDHRPWYDRQRPDRFADALRAAKAELDPKAILNPGVLVDPRRGDSV